MQSSVDAYYSILVLDPRISYEGLQDDAKDDPSALAHIDAAKAELEAHYKAKYARSLPAHLVSSPTPTTSTPASPQRVDFTVRYRRPTRELVDELQEYFKKILSLAISFNGGPGVVLSFQIFLVLPETFSLFQASSIHIYISLASHRLSLQGQLLQLSGSSQEVEIRSRYEEQA
jgi:hypothetical protein